MIITLINLFNVNVLVTCRIIVGFCTKNKILQIQLVYVALNYLYNAIMIKSRLIYRWIIIFFIPYMLAFTLELFMCLDPYSRH